MRARFVASWAIVGVLVAIPAVGMAQDATEEPAIRFDAESEQGDFVGFRFDLNPEAVSETCVVARNDALGGSTLTLVLFANMAGPGNWVPGIPYEADARGAMAEAGVGDCYGPSEDPDNAA